jgi:hypothetical protein
MRDWAEQIGEIPEPWEELRAAGGGSSLELPRWEEHGASRGGRHTRLTAAEAHEATGRGSRRWAGVWAAPTKKVARAVAAGG